MSNNYEKINIINDIRNNIVVKNSEVLSENVTDPVIVEDLKKAVYPERNQCFDWYEEKKPPVCWSKHFDGYDKEMPSAMAVGDFKCRSIKNGKDTYYVAEGCQEQKGQKLIEHHAYGWKSVKYAEECVSVRNFSVKHNENMTNLSLLKRAITISGNDLDPLVTLNVNGHKYKLNANTNISDINSVRYNVRDNKEAAYFLDKFVIVSPEERKAYKKYEEKKNKEARKQQLIKVKQDIKKSVQEPVKKVADKYRAKIKEKYFTGR